MEQNKIIQDLQRRRANFEQEIAKIDAQIEQQKCQCQTCHCHRNWNDLPALKARVAELEAEEEAKQAALEAEAPAEATE